MYRSRLLPVLGLAAVVMVPAVHAAPTDPTANCTFAGFIDPTPDTAPELTLSLVGQANAPSAVRTRVACRVRGAGGATVLQASRTCVGSACAVAGLSSGIPLSPLTVCVSATATYVDNSVATFPETCSTSIAG